MLTFSPTQNFRSLCSLGCNYSFPPRPSCCPFLFNHESKLTPFTLVCTPSVLLISVFSYLSPFLGIGGLLPTLFPFLHTHVFDGTLFFLRHTRSFSFPYSLLFFVLLVIDISYFASPSCRPACPPHLSALSGRPLGPLLPAPCPS